MMWAKSEIAKLDKYCKPCGPCIFCGHKDKRHRMWDSVLAYHNGGDSIELIAAQLELNIEYVKLILQIKPYHRNNY